MKKNNWQQYTFNLILSHVLYVYFRKEFNLSQLNEIITFNLTKNKYFKNKYNFDNTINEYLKDKKYINVIKTKIIIPDFINNPKEEEIKKYFLDDKETKLLKNFLIKNNIKYYNLNNYKKVFITSKIASNEFNNEFLEWLGDRVVNSIIINYLIKQKKINAHIELIKATLLSWSAYIEYDKKINLKDIVYKINKTENNQIISDSFESLSAAIFLDKGFNYTKKWMIEKLDEIIDIKLIKKLQTKRFVISFLDRKKIIKKKKEVKPISNGFFEAKYIIIYNEKEFKNTAKHKDPIKAKDLAIEKIFFDLYEYDEKIKRKIDKLYIW